MLNHLPTCRRGEGFAIVQDLDVADGFIRGQAVPYGSMVELWPGMLEVFEPGCFRRQLKDPARVKLCLEHGQVIGRIETLRETSDALHFEGRIAASPDIPEARRARALLDENLVDELSIGFNTVAGGSEQHTRDDGQTLVRHKRARLLEISLVPWGVYGREATLSRSVLRDPAEVEAARLKAQRRAEAVEYAKRYRGAK